LRRYGVPLSLHALLVCHPVGICFCSCRCCCLFYVVILTLSGAERGRIPVFAVAVAVVFGVAFACHSDPERSEGKEPRISRGERSNPSASPLKPKKINPRILQNFLTPKNVHQQTIFTMHFTTLCPSKNHV
jgi:hypothetical protein